MDDTKHSPISLQQIDREQPVRKSSITHAPIPAPPADDMAPQSISFIGSSDKQLSEGKCLKIHKHWVLNLGIKSVKSKSN